MGVLRTSRKRFVVADRATGMIIDFEIYENMQDDVDVAINKLINLCLENGAPGDIQIRSERMEAIFGDFCQKSGIKLKRVKRLSRVDKLLKELASHV